MSTTSVRSHADSAAVSGRHANRRRRPAGVRPDSDTVGPFTGIVDVRGQQTVIRVSGYVPGNGDIHVAPAQTRQYGLRRGDAVTGTARLGGRDAALDVIETVNGQDPGGTRPDFAKLTALYPRDRIRLETEPQVLTTRVIDLVMPIGKGQRALIVSPPKAGKTMVMQAVANAISRNNPECHLMVVLVDERPEEVTDMRRSVRGEVVWSTFDRPPTDHIAVAELAIERAKRLVELGRDVVVLLDSITRLGRAYNNAAPSGGRTLTGGVDAGALHQPKQLLGAARNVEEGGSLTIIATAMVDNGSAGDNLIFEEFKSTGNAELRLDRRVAEKRVFPAIDIESSGTRKEEILLAPDELAIVRTLRRALQSRESRYGLDQLLDQLRRTTSNTEFLVRLARANDTGSAFASAR